MIPQETRTGGSHATHAVGFASRDRVIPILIATTHRHGEVRIEFGAGQDRVAVGIEFGHMGREPWFGARTFGSFGPTSLTAAGCSIGRRGRRRRPGDRPSEQHGVVQIEVAVPDELGTMPVDLVESVGIGSDPLAGMHGGGRPRRVIELRTRPVRRWLRGADPRTAHVAVEGPVVDRPDLPVLVGDDRIPDRHDESAVADVRAFVLQTRLRIREVAGLHRDRHRVLGDDLEADDIVRRELDRIDRDEPTVDVEFEPVVRVHRDRNRDRALAGRTRRRRIPSSLGRGIGLGPALTSSGPVAWAGGAAAFASPAGAPVLTGRARAVEVRIRSEQSGRGGLSLPRLQGGEHGAGSGGFALGEVGRLARIRREVVELDRAVLERFDDLPVSVAHDAARRIAADVRGEVPEEAIAIDRGAAAEFAGEALAIEVLALKILGDRDVAEFEQRRHEVDRLARRRRSSSTAHAGAGHDERNADAALVHRALVRPQRRVVGDVAAVVAGEHDDRVLGNLRDQAADALIDVLDHRGVGRTIPVEIGVGRDARLRGGQRRVHRVGGEEDEERSVARLSCDVDRLVEEHVGRIALAVEVAVPEAESLVVPELVEALAGRTVRGVGALAEVPLADARGGVAGVAEHLRDRAERGIEIGVVRRGDEPSALRSSAHRVLDGVHAVPGRPESGHEARPGRRAVRGRGVRLIEDHAPGREPIEIRGPVHGRPGAAEVLPAEVVDQDEDHVGAIGG